MPILEYRAKPTWPHQLWERRYVSEKDAEWLIAIWTHDFEIRRVSVTLPEAIAFFRERFRGRFKRGFK